MGHMYMGHSSTIIGTAGSKDPGIHQSSMYVLKDIAYSLPLAIMGVCKMFLD